jgi:lipopolysaccharide cholinephosphotransferase
MFNNKIRIRSKEELESRKKGFLEICKILDNLNIFYFIQGGALLGARREKKFIEWDWDVEISLYDYDFIKNFDDIIKNLSLDNFSIIKLEKYNNQKIDCYKEFSPEATTFTLLSWSYSKKNKNYYRSKFKIPEYFLNKYDEIFFYGKKFYTPSPMDDYLSYQYGNWKIRKRTANKQEYLTGLYFKKENLIIRIIKNIFNKFKKY